MNKMTINVELGKNSYDILIARGALSRVDKEVILI